MALAEGSSVELSKIKPSSTGSDIAIYPYYNIKPAVEGKPSLGLTGVDTDGDGIVDHYTVEAVGTLADNVVIPGEINGVPVTVVTDLTSSNWASNVSSIVVQEGVKRIESGAFADTPGLKVVSLPSTIEYLGKSAFVDDGFIGGIGSLVNYKKPAITYNGTKAQWDALIANSDGDWDNNLGEGSTIICTDGTYTATKDRWNSPIVWEWSPKTN